MGFSNKTIDEYTIMGITIFPKELRKRKIPTDARSAAEALVIEMKRDRIFSTPETSMNE